MDFVVVIPARYGARRLPGKPLRPIAGRPMIQHVYERAAASGAAQVVVATDDPRIRDAVEGFGAPCCLTSPHHASGTERLAEAVDILGLPDEAVVVNVQGDEPLIPPAAVRQVAADALAHSEVHLCTLATPIRTAAELFDPHVVKVVTDEAGYALYFSRAPIPWDREAFAVTTEQLPDDQVHFRHLGLYAYRAGFLRRYAALPSCALEKTEVLEQLRALWCGERIHVSVTDDPPGHGVDTEADLQRVAAILSSPAGCG